ncbi:hypothetical protein K438DRAFT_1764382 [Mycena galopus ATCC 62051]|nr:hypothetical protein K438DRAFT_1764382 [Mycena galopus ATCC 62051]
MAPPLLDLLHFISPSLSLVRISSLVHSRPLILIFPQLSLLRMESGPMSPDHLAACGLFLFLRRGTSIACLDEHDPSFPHPHPSAPGAPLSPWTTRRAVPLATSAVLSLLDLLQMLDTLLLVLDPPFSTSATTFLGYDTAPPTSRRFRPSFLMSDATPAALLAVRFLTISPSCLYSILYLHPTISPLFGGLAVCLGMAFTPPSSAVTPTRATPPFHCLGYRLCIAYHTTLHISTILGDAACICIAHRGIACTDYSTVYHHTARIHPRQQHLYRLFNYSPLYHRHLFVRLLLATFFFVAADAGNAALLSLASLFGSALSTLLFLVSLVSPLLFVLLYPRIVCFQFVLLLHRLVSLSSLGLHSVAFRLRPWLALGLQLTLSPTILCFRAKRKLDANQYSKISPSLSPSLVLSSPRHPDGLPHTPQIKLAQSLIIQNNDKALRNKYLDEWGTGVY